LLKTDVRDEVLAGRLERAGVALLRLAPEAVSAARTIVAIAARQQQQSSPSSSSSSSVQLLASSKLASLLEAVEQRLGSVDVAIGQGMRGQMGVSAAAQLQVLQELDEVQAALDDFVEYAEKNVFAPVPDRSTR